MPDPSIAGGTKKRAGELVPGPDLSSRRLLEAGAEASVEVAAADVVDAAAGADAGQAERRIAIR